MFWISPIPGSECSSMWDAVLRARAFCCQRGRLTLGGPTRVPASDPDRDPFGERSAGRWRVRRQLLGGRFLFTSNSRRLLRLADSAYRGLLPQRLPWPAATFELELRLTPARTLRGAGTPPALRTFAGPG